MHVTQVTTHTGHTASHPRLGDSQSSDRGLSADSLQTPRRPPQTPAARTLSPQPLPATLTAICTHKHTSPHNGQPPKVPRDRPPALQPARLRPAHLQRRAAPRVPRRPARVDYPPVPLQRPLLHPRLPLPHPHHPLPARHHHPHRPRLLPAPLLPRAHAVHPAVHAVQQEAQRRRRRLAPRRAARRGRRRAHARRPPRPGRLLGRRVRRGAGAAGRAQLVRRPVHRRGARCRRRERGDGAGDGGRRAGAEGRGRGCKAGGGARRAEAGGDAEVYGDGGGAEGPAAAAERGCGAEAVVRSVFSGWGDVDTIVDSLRGKVLIQIVDSLWSLRGSCETAMFC